jgi:hypothetical protein
MDTTCEARSYLSNLGLLVPNIDGEWDRRGALGAQARSAKARWREGRRWHGVVESWQGAATWRLLGVVEVSREGMEAAAVFCASMRG